MGVSFVTIPHYNNKVQPFASKYVGAKLPFYDIRLWTRSSVLQGSLGFPEGDPSFYGFGLGKEFKLLEIFSQFSSKLVVDFNYHKMEQLKTIHRIEQIGLNLLLVLHSKVIIGLKPFLSIGFFKQKWQVKHPGASGLSGESKEGSELGLVGSAVSIPVKAGIRVDLGPLDFFAEYSLVGQNGYKESLSLAAGLSV